MLTKKEIAKIVTNRGFTLTYSKGQFKAEGRAVSPKEILQLKHAVEDEPET
jgi:hypothetical protein